MTYTVETYATEREWLTARMDSVGASESSAVVGYNPWCSALGLSFRKQERRVEPDDDNAGPMLEWGHRLERAIADKWLDAMGYPAEGLHRIKDPGEYTLYRSEERPHVTCTPDRLLLLGDWLKSELQIKTAHFKSMDKWLGDTFPLQYQIQCSHTMYVLGTDIAHIAVLGDGYKFIRKSLARNQKFIDRLMVRIDEFWFDYVQKGIHPPADFSKSSAHTLSSIYPEANGQSMELPLEMADLGEDYDAACAEEKAAKDKKAGLANRVKQAMGDASVGVLPCNGGFTWKANGKGRTLRRNKKLRSENA